MKGFDNYLVQSLRKEPDWSGHYVNYADLKSNLIAFVKRRKYLSDLIDSGTAITNEDIENARIIKKQTPANHGMPNTTSDNFDENNNGNDTEPTSDYHKFTDYEYVKRNSFAMDEIGIFRMLSRLERSEFCALLDSHVERAASFYAGCLLSLSNSMLSRKVKLAFLEEIESPEMGSAAAGDIHANEGNLQQYGENCEIDEDEKVSGINSVSSISSGSDVTYAILGDELLELFAFAVTNIIAVRQILIRYDAFARQVGGAPLTDWYIETRQNESSGTNFHDLFQFQALLVLQVTFSTMVHELQVQFMRVKKTGVHSSIVYMKNFNSQFNHFKMLLEKTHLSLEMSASGQHIFKDYFITVLRRNFALGSISRSLDMEPNFLRMRGRHLKEEIADIANWRKNKGKKDSTDYFEGETSAYSKIDSNNIVPLVLNLFACFLYMMNNYIVEPSAAYYVNELKASDAVSGILIGAMPWANISAAIGYSEWTNRSYRQPLLFAGVLMCIGNVMYSCAYNYKSIWMCVLGRAITGLGGPRLINRRYVADATPFSLRTAASASFAGATALGAAMGPAAAILLDYMNMEIVTPVGVIYINGMTGPGYLMAILWVIYLVIFFPTFNEPKRVGLEELKHRELLRKDSEESGRLAEIEIIESCTSIDFEEIAESSPTVPTEKSSKNVLQEIFNDAYSCLKHINVSVKTCMILIFVKRIILESVMGSTSVLTKNRYGWSVRSVGTLHFVNGLIVIPLAILAGWLSQYYEDRYLILRLICISTIGTFVLIDFSDIQSSENNTYNESSFFAVGQTRYIVGYMIAFSAIEACESFVASVMSKVVPSELASGTFNSGLLTTLVGTGGRATGDLFITTMAFISLRGLANLLFFPSFFMSLLMIALAYANYDFLYA